MPPGWQAHAGLAGMLVAFAVAAASVIGYVVATFARNIWLEFRRK